MTHRPLCPKLAKSCLDLLHRFHLYIQSMALTGNAVWFWIVNHHLIHSRLNCHYANCSTLSTSFDCKFMTSNRSLLAEATNEKCWHILQDHRLHHANKTTNYTCILTRRKRREEKHITIDYSICRGKSKYKTHIFKKNA